MASETIEDIPLSTLYLQIEYGNTPFAVLGIGSKGSEIEIREAYRAIALRIHPDKAPSDNLREVHTLLFQKVQIAYDSLLKTQEDDETSQFHPSRQLPETFASLHTRNVAFREALRSEREKALRAKNAADILKASKEARLKAKNESLAEKRELRSRTLEEEQAKRQNEIAKEQRWKTHHGRNEAEDAKQPESETKKRNTGLSDWEEMEDDLQAKAQREADDIEKPQIPLDVPKFKPPLQNKPTARTARSTWDKALDERLVSDAQIEGRWNTSLLSGGRSGSVSLGQKNQREKNAVARAHKATLTLCEEADHMLKPALTGNRTFSAMEEEDLMQSAFVRTEEKAQARTERFLQVMDGEVTEQFLLEQGEPGQSSPFASLTIKDE